MNDLVTQAECARRLKVNRSAINYYKEKGYLDGCFQEENGKQKIIFSKAKASLSEKLDISQRVANGRADLGQRSAIDEINKDSPEYQLKLERLEKARYENKKAQEEEQRRIGVYVLKSEVEAEVASAVTNTVQVLEGALDPLAHAIAAKFSIQHRDVIHLLREEFKKIRTDASDKFKKLQGQQQKLIRNDVSDEPEIS